MAVNVKFFRPVDGGSGRIDPMRVLDIGAGHIADDLDRRVLFSALNMSPGYAEERAWASSGSDFAGVWNVDFTTTRAYKAPPVALAVYANPNGQRFYPGLVQLGATTNWRFYMRVLSRNGNGTYQCRVEIQTRNINGTPMTGGVLRVFVFGDQ